MKLRVIFLILIFCFITVSVQARVPGRTYYDRQNNQFIYIIRAGDTFFNISQTFKIDLDRLKGLNYNLNPRSLQVGDQVLISINEDLNYHLTTSSDTLWEISQTSKLTMDDIIAYNRLENPNKLTVNEIILLPSLVAENNNIKVLEFYQKNGLVYVTGVARVFEATVNYAFETETGEVLMEGFTTATTGGPEWGKYIFKSYIPARANYLSVFHISAKDGSRLYEIRLELR
ncbi:LysM peptidoglycan-binding domain-containing protein [Natronospora cellulosivora (SeqCode)]